MNKKMLLVIGVVIVVLAGGGIVLAMQHNNKNDSSDSMGGMDMSKSGSSAKSNSTPITADAVVIQNFAFAPASITVKKGTTVTWTNKDSTAHTVTETDGQTGPDSGDLATGKSYSFTYDTAGTFKYHCAIHPDMVGTVTVTD